MMVDTELAAPQMKRLAMNIYNSSRRIQEMLQDLLNVTRGRTGLMETCGVREMVLGATESLAGEADSRGVEIDVEIPEELELPLERARMERVFQNLVHNALEVMPEGGAIHIAVREAADHVVVSVEDTGPGISREIRQRLFQPFVSYGKKNGLGLGLALSRQTVLDHGGDIWVESEEGHGARFLIRLPRSPRGAGLPPVEAAIGR
jgi:signal transduction histidine kinase